MEQYDKVYREINDYKYLMNKIATGIMLFFAGMLALFPYQIEDRLMPLYVFCFMNVALGTYMNSYTRINEKGKAFTIFQKLKYIPVDPQTILKNRRRLLLRFLGKTTLVMQLIQLASALFFCHKITFWNLYPLLEGILIGVLWLLYLYWSKKRSK